MTNPPNSGRSSLGHRSLSGAALLTSLLGACLMMTSCAVTTPAGSQIGLERGSSLALAELSESNPEFGGGVDLVGRRTPEASFNTVAAMPQQTAQTGWRPTASMTLGFGPSNFRFKQSGGLNDSERGVSGRFKGEAFFGHSPVAPALHASWTRSGDLFEGQTKSDGLSSQSATAKATHVDFFPHAAFRAVRTRHFDLIIRAGAVVDYLNLDHEAATLDSDYLSIGPKIAIEPEVFFFNSKRSAFSWFASAGYAYGWSVVSDTNAVVDENYSSTAEFLEAESGLRFRAGKFRGSVSYLYGFADVDTTDAKNSIALASSEYTRKMLMLEFGVDF